jgi:hypothetical protein
MSEATKLHELTANLVISESSIAEFISLFAYAGFNPEMVHDHFSKIKTQKNISNPDFQNDIQAIIALGATKGNITVRNSSKISEAGRTVLDRLFTTYQMKKGSIGTDRRAVTLPRVLSAFPELTSKVVLRCPDKNFGYRTNALSRFVKNPVFAAMVPSSLEISVKSFFLAIYNVYSAEQTLTISKVSDFQEALNKQVQYTDIAHNSSVPTEKDRISYFLKARTMLAQDVVAGSGIEGVQAITAEAFNAAMDGLQVL